MAGLDATQAAGAVAPPKKRHPTELERTKNRLADLAQKHNAIMIDNTNYRLRAKEQQVVIQDLHDEVHELSLKNTKLAAQLERARQVVSPFDDDELRLLVPFLNVLLQSVPALATLRDRLGSPHAPPSPAPAPTTFRSGAYPPRLAKISETPRAETLIEEDEDEIAGLATPSPSFQSLLSCPASASSFSSSSYSSSSSSSPDANVNLTSRSQSRTSRAVRRTSFTAGQIVSSSEPTLSPDCAVASPEPEDDGQIGIIPDETAPAFEDAEEITTSTVRSLPGLSKRPASPSAQLGPVASQPTPSIPSFSIDPLVSLSSLSIPLSESSSAIRAPFPALPPPTVASWAAAPPAPTASVTLAPSEWSITAQSLILSTNSTSALSARGAAPPLPPALSSETKATLSAPVSIPEAPLLTPQAASLAPSTPTPDPSLQPYVGDSGKTASTISSDGAEEASQGRRGGGRARSSVNYKEPSLTKKMRKPGPDESSASASRAHSSSSSKRPHSPRPRHPSELEGEDSSFDSPSAVAPGPRRKSTLPSRSQLASVRAPAPLPDESASACSDVESSADGSAMEDEDGVEELLAAGPAGGENVEEIPDEAIDGRGDENRPPSKDSESRGALVPPKPRLQARPLQAAKPAPRAATAPISSSRPINTSSYSATQSRAFSSTLAPRPSSSASNASTSSTVSSRSNSTTPSVSSVSSSAKAPRPSQVSKPRPSLSSSSGSADLSDEEDRRRDPDATPRAFKIVTPAPRLSVNGSSSSIVGRGRRESGTVAPLRVSNAASGSGAAGRKSVVSASKADDSEAKLQQADRRTSRRVSMGGALM